MICHFKKWSIQSCLLYVFFTILLNVFLSAAAFNEYQYEQNYVCCHKVTQCSTRFSLIRYKSALKPCVSFHILYILCLLRYSHTANVIGDRLLLLGGANTNHPSPGLAVVDLRTSTVQEYNIPVSQIVHLTSLLGNINVQHWQTPFLHILSR